MAIELFMTEDQSVIVARRKADGFVVEFRGRPYHLWEEGEDTPMYRLHSLLWRINISDLHAGRVEVVTPWHPEWDAVNAMFEAALAAQPK